MERLSALGLTVTGGGGSGSSTPAGSRSVHSASNSGCGPSTPAGSRSNGTGSGSSTPTVSRSIPSSPRPVGPGPRPPFSYPGGSNTPVRSPAPNSDSPLRPSSSPAMANKRLSGEVELPNCLMFSLWRVSLRTVAWCSFVSIPTYLGLHKKEMEKRLSVYFWSELA